jgi:hypothetical protein
VALFLFRGFNKTTCIKQVGYHICLTPRRSKSSWYILFNPHFFLGQTGIPAEKDAFPRTGLFICALRGILGIFPKNSNILAKAP